MRSIEHRSGLVERPKEWLQELGLAQRWGSRLSREHQSACLVVQRVALETWLEVARGRKMVVEAEFATCVTWGCLIRARASANLDAAFAGLAGGTSRGSWWSSVGAVGTTDAGRRAIAVRLGMACSTFPAVASGSSAAHREGVHAGRAAVTALTLANLTAACGKLVGMCDSW